VSAARGNDSGSRSGSVTSTVSATPDGQGLAGARERHNQALGIPAEITAEASAGPGQSDTTKAVFVFSEKATEAVMQAGWTAPQAKADHTFASHGERVRAYVAIATALGHSAEVGVLQANFGSGRSAPGPEGDWRNVNLDLNGDGIIDGKDLELARQREAKR
jgi:hypothetical protein